MQKDIPGPGKRNNADLLEPSGEALFVRESFGFGRKPSFFHTIQWNLNDGKRFDLSTVRIAKNPIGQETNFLPYTIHHFDEQGMIKHSIVSSL
jgi:hypothetical protein